MPGQKRKGLRKSKFYINNLSNIFVKSSLERLYHFYKDEAQASLLFNRVNQFEAYYLLTFFNILQSNVLQASFDKSVHCFLQEVKAIVLSKNNYTCKVKVVNKYPGQISDIMFWKTPAYKPTHDQCDYSESQSVNSRENSKISVISTTVTERSIIVHYARKASVSTQSNPSGTANSNGISQTNDVLDEVMVYRASKRGQFEDCNNNMSVPCKSDEALNESGTSQNRNKRSTERGLSDRMAEIKEDMSVPVKCEKARNEAGTSKYRKRNNRNKRYTERGGLSDRMAKIKEDLSVPVKCEKALKMMRMMGWDGGALGARGDGMVEPIMPSLNNIMQRAGLGHGDLIGNQRSSSECCSQSSNAETVIVISDDSDQDEDVKNGDGMRTPDAVEPQVNEDQCRCM